MRGGPGMPGGPGMRGGPGMQGAAPGQRPAGPGDGGGTGTDPGSDGWSQFQAPPGQFQGLPGRDGSTQAPGSGGGSSAGSLLEGSTPGAALTAALLADADQFTWVAAAVGANSAAGYQLATQRPVMAIGGFNGSDPAPTLTQFQDLVRTGRIHYFVAGGMGAGGMGAGGMGAGGRGGQLGGSQAASEISAWVAQNYAATTVDGVTLYDLTNPSSSGALATASTDAEA